MKTTFGTLSLVELREEFVRQVELNNIGRECHWGHDRYSSVNARPAHVCTPARRTMISGEVYRKGACIPMRRVRGKKERFGQAMTMRVWCTTFMKIRGFFSMGMYGNEPRCRSDRTLCSMNHCSIPASDHECYPRARRYSCLFTPGYQELTVGP
jgi:hypothetical protein